VQSYDFGVEQGKLRILKLFSTYFQGRNAEGIAVILKSIPRDAEFADLICDGFTKLRSIDKSFFSRSQRFAHH
jgi:hypothetical protein